MPSAVSSGGLGCPFVNGGCSYFIASLTFIVVHSIGSCFVGFTFKACSKGIGLGCNFLKIVYSSHGLSFDAITTIVINFRLALRRGHLLPH